MSNNHLTDKELIHYLSLTSSDPLILRLVNMLHSTRGGLVYDLEEAGMDPETLTFSYEYANYSPGQLITQLEKDLDWIKDEAEDLKYKLEEMTEERDELRTRSIVDFIQEVEQGRQAAINERKFAIAESQRLGKENDELREKINVWKILETE